jgi:nicotinate-nucleotide pyrophosphorylase (carboxylating)
LAEDIGSGDHSTLSCIPADARRKARLIIKGRCIVAGVELAQLIFKHFDPTLEIEVFLKDGDKANPGDIAFVVQGNARSILSCERVVLNTMQRMCGIASYTRKMVSLIADTQTKLLDTRKTTPNFRMAEKWAVIIGGAENHRFGLFDMVMLKDNHIDFAGGIEKAVAATKEYLSREQLTLPIIVETRNLAEVAQAIKADVFRILLDNMSPTMMAEAVKMVNGACQTEASGGITEVTMREVAQTGVTYISIGALTHSARNVDISLKAF